MTNNSAPINCCVVWSASDSLANQLISEYGWRKPKRKKAKAPDEGAGPAQSERFIEAAKKLWADEVEAFERAMGAILKPKQKTWSN